MLTIGITAVGGGVGQSVLRSLAVSDFDHRTVGMDSTAHNSGIHWADSARIVPRIDDPDYLDRMLAVCLEEKIDLLIPGLDTELAILARERARFAAQGCVVVVGDSRAVQLSTDKLECGRWCASLALPFVPTLSLPEAQEAAETLTFPVILKPRYGSASAGARLIRTVNELHAVASDDDLIVQEYLPPRGLDYVAVDDRGRSQPEQLHEISAQYFLNHHGEVLGSFVSINRLKAGVPVEIIPVVDQPWVDDAVPIVRALAKLGARGPVNLQGRLTASGRVVFFEINARFTGITGIRALMGYREVEAGARSLVLGDDQGAIECLRFDPAFIGFRHVGDMITPRARVAALEKIGSTTRRPTRSPAPTILVTGADGYIGHEVVSDLLGSHPEYGVRALTRTTESITRLSEDFIDSTNFFAERGDLHCRLPGLRDVDTVVHLAARRITEHSEAELYEVNVEGTRRLIAAARDAGVRRFVYLSSQSVYGTSQRPPWGEALTPRPETAYGATKFLGELLCRGEFGGEMEFVILRAARAFGVGPRMRWEELPHNFARRAAAGQPLMISGDGTQRMDLVHVSDLARAITRSVATALPPTGRTILNIGGGHPISLNELATCYTRAAKSMGLTPPLVELTPSTNPPSPSFGMHIRRARELLGWAPSISMDDAVGELIALARELAGSE